ncbi:hypothetical protein LJC08_01570 [Methanimicrococcus sp. OttesenSCG-928-J09]|nr:hypothetical protein [Methanimicrococcus sp. OttesenSCG-928-J09]
MIRLLTVSVSACYLTVSVSACCLTASISACCLIVSVLLLPALLAAANSRARPAQILKK